MISLSQNPELVECGRRIRNDQRGEKREKLIAFLFLDRGFLPGISLKWEKGKVLFFNKISFNYIIELDWRRQWQPTPALLPGKSHGQRSLVVYSPWGLEGLDTAEWLQFHFSLSWIGEGNGNPLQCSCLENPRDGGAWWAAICGVAQSWTWLKWLSSRTRYICYHPNRMLCDLKRWENYLCCSGLDKRVTGPACISLGTEEKTVP